MMTIGESVELYVHSLSGANAEDAWHALVELGPSALPHVIAAFDAASHLDTQVSLVRVIAEYRTAEGVPFLAGLLSHDEASIWKSAIDALVTAGCRAAVEALLAARAAAPQAQRERIDEAIPQAIASLTEAAERGDIGAQCDFGIICAGGRGVAADNMQARTWIRRAAEQGHAEAQYYLGDTSDEEEQEEAVEWLRQAGEQGHVAAQFALALKYEGTDGVWPDAEEAVTWLRRAAERGHADAQRLLGGHYASGDGVAQDDTEAVGWLRKAAEQGNAAAQFELGEMFAVGRGVPQHDMQAAVWMCKAGESGDDFLRYKFVDRYEKASATAREAMDRVMSSEQRANVQRQLREWREGFENRHRHN
jgi:TPR repeat protein